MSGMGQPGTTGGQRGNLCGAGEGGVPETRTGRRILRERDEPEVRGRDPGDQLPPRIDMNRVVGVWRVRSTESQ